MYVIAYGESRKTGSKPFINDLRPSWNHRSQEVAIPVVKIRMVLRLLAEDGWVLVATRGSHRQFEHQVKRGRVTVAGKDSDDLAPGTYNSILKQAKLKGP
jgi:predicted RNA binding protein YcfA (HicA-like mRNA interferase family)